MPPRSRVVKAVAAQLLPQPHGFEGLGTVPELLHADDPALAHREHARGLHVRLRPVACPVPDLSHDNPVPGVDDVAQFRYVGIEGLAELVEPAHDRLPAYERPRLRPTIRRPP